MELTSNSKVLVVDDQDIVVTQNKMILARVYGIDMSSILVAYDGEEALEVLDANPDIDLVVSDMDMPGMDGLTLFTEMRDRDERNIPFLMSTGGNAEIQTEIENIFASCGGNALFTEKPTSMAKIQEAIDILEPKKPDSVSPVPSA